MKLIKQYPAFFWFVWCAMLGTIGWSLHNFTLYQPILVWIIGTMVFETFSLFFILILSSMLTSMIFWGHKDVIAQLAFHSMGVKHDNPNRSKNFCTVLMILFHLTINFFMAYSLVVGQT